VLGILLHSLLGRTLSDVVFKRLCALSLVSQLCGLYGLPFSSILASMDGDRSRVQVLLRVQLLSFTATYGYWSITRFCHPHHLSLCSACFNHTPTNLFCLNDPCCICMLGYTTPLADLGPEPKRARCQSQMPDAIEPDARARCQSLRPVKCLAMQGYPTV